MTSPDKIAAKPSRLALSGGALALFFLSFLMSGDGNALPQLFFERHNPGQKTLYLSIALSTSTAAAIVGVLLSKRYMLGRGTSLCLLAVLGVLIEALLFSPHAAAFLVVLSAVQFLANYLLHRIDESGVARAGNLRGFNDAVGLGARLLGMLTAPVFFTIFAAKRLVTAPVTGMLGLAAIAGAAALLTTNSPCTNMAERASKSTRVGRPDRLIFLFAGCVYISLYLFAANMIYLLRDVLRYDKPDVHGGLTIVTVFAAALVSNGVAGFVGSKLTTHRNNVIHFAYAASPAIVLLILGSLLALGARVPYQLFLCCSATVGGAYGVFLWAIRDYASREADERGKVTLLSWFNNMANVSSLCAFCLMLALASARLHAPSDYYSEVLWTIALMPAFGLALLWRARMELEGGPI